VESAVPASRASRAAADRGGVRFETADGGSSDRTSISQLWLIRRNIIVSQEVEGGIRQVVASRYGYA
jgi:hypothetical protein